MSKMIDITGQRFGRLVALEKVATTGSTTNACWRCVCDCGKEAVVKGVLLRKGEVRSCGCYKADLNRQQLTKHGKCNTRLAHIWYQMKERCYCKTSTNYKNYGGRGISVCNEWLQDFQAFYDWAMANGYSDDLTIDRINNDGNYEPSNCRWVNAKIQAENRRSSKEFCVGGIKFLISQSQELFGINPKTVWNRLYKGWDIERAVKEPVSQAHALLSRNKD